jgi:hypothetical protein
MRGRARKLLGAALSIAGHLAILLALLMPRAEPARRFVPVATTVALVDVRPFTPRAASLAAANPAPAEAPPPRTPPRTIVRPAPDPLPAAQAPAADEGAELSEAQLAGAASAGAGPAGGGCDMAGRVQDALRKDPLVRAAVAGSAGKATMVWNGDWVRSRGEDGKGLAAVREAIMWEVAFAPRACRGQPMRGLVLISLNQAPGSARLAVGADEWRWSDLLTPRPAASADASPGR